MTAYDETSRVPGGWPPQFDLPPLGDLRPEPGSPAAAPPAGNAADPGPADPRPADPGPAGPGADQATILPDSELLVLHSGTRVRVKPLATRELLALLNIGVAGVGPRLADLNLDPDDPIETFMARFAGLIITGLGAAGDEATAFLRMVIEPEAKVRTFRPDRAQKARNQALDAALDDEMWNPHPDDTISIIEKIAEMNAGDLQAWGKRLAGIFKLAQRTGQIPASRTSRA